MFNNSDDAANTNQSFFGWLMGRGATTPENNNEQVGGRAKSGVSKIFGKIIFSVLCGMLCDTQVADDIIYAHNYNHRYCGSRAGYFGSRPLGPDVFDYERFNDGNYFGNRL